jgi:arginase
MSDQLGQVITIVSAPSNLGLRPPETGSVPGTSKAPEALREAGLFQLLTSGGAVDGGAVVPGRYVDDDATRPTGHVRNEVQLVEHARRLANRIASVIADGSAPLVLGGDCSLLIASGLALKSQGSAGLIHIDGHTDFRHPGNSDDCASVAGEDLAAVIGLHWPAIGDIDGCGPYFLSANTAHIGCRDSDQDADEARSLLGLVLPAREAIEIGMDAVAQAARFTAGSFGYWLHVDVDVLDPSFMPAVDSPDSGGLNPDQLIELLRGLAPYAIGAQVTVFDPDHDPDGKYAALLTDIITMGMTSLGSEWMKTAQS